MATFKEVFPLIRDGKLWTGYTHPKEFLQPDGTYKKFGNTLWWTNMFVDKPFTLNPDKKYYGNEDKYPRYDNYDAINVDKLADIPSDYSGIMGVPVTFIEHYVPPLADRGGHRLRIHGFRKGTDDKDLRANGRYYYMRYLVSVNI